MKPFTTLCLTALLLAPLVALHAADAPPARPLLLANYYCWYHDGHHPKQPFLHWTYPSSATNALAKKAQKPGEPPPNSVFRPLAGLYDSADPKVAEWHVQLAKAAGIDAFLVDWWDTHNQLDQNVDRGIVAAAQKHGFKFALLDERAQFHNKFEDYQEMLARGLKRYKDNPAYLRIEGRPVVYLYQVATKPGLTPAEFPLLKKYVEGQVGPVYWIVDKIAHDGKASKAGDRDREKCIPADWLATPGVDSFGFYSTFSNFRAHDYDALAGKYRYLTKLAHDAGKKMLLPVHPGHDNSNFRDDPYVMPRRDGQTLRDFLRAATDAKADYIMVTSWNEWPESTVIEPSSSWPDPYLYLKILAEWKGVTFTQPARSTALQLAQNGATRYAILVPDEATPVEVTAAEELRAYLTKITGAAFVVVKEGLAVDGQPVLAVGRTRKFASTFPAITLDTLKPDSIVMQSKGEDLFLVGEGTRGTIYAVNTFLEDICGVRWWSAFAETVPDNPGLAVSPLATVYQPAFFYRDTHSQIFTDTMMSKYGDQIPKGLEERRRFAARCKNNGNNDIPAAWGGNLTIVISQKCYRTFEQFIGLHEFYKTHPEWFQGGASHLTQLCLSSGSMRAEFLKRAKAWVDAAPDQNVFVIMHNDNASYCRCTQCAAIDLEEGSPSGSQVRFMNFLSEELEKHRPGLQLVMDAYNYSTKPPTLTKPRANLIIMLCPPILSQLVAKDQEFMDKWAAWKKITSRILIWDYTVNFASFVSPYPNLRFLGPNIKTFAQQGAVGVFSQGNQFNSVSDCDELKSWVIAHLLWDPSRDADALIAEFVNGYYGAAAKPVMAYLDLIVRAGSGAKEQGETAISWLDIQAINEATRLLNEARAIATDDPVLEERVARIRFTLDHEWLLEWRAYRKQADEQGLPFLGPETLRKALDRVRQETARFGATHNNEHYGYGTLQRHLETMQVVLDAADPGKPLPPPYDQIPTADVFQIQDNLLNLSSGAKGVADPLASDGKAVMSPCTHKDWNIQVNRMFFRTLHRMTGVEGKWKCVIFVRADARQQTGPAMQMGIYCWGNPAVRPQKKVAIEQLTPNAYTPIEVGSLDLGTDALLNTDIWVGPLENPELMNAIYVDRVVFIRKKNEDQNTGKK